MRTNIKLIALFICLGMLLYSGCGKESGNSESPLPTTSIFASPTDTDKSQSPIETTGTARPPCLTQFEPVGNTVCGYVIDKRTGRPVVGRPVFLAEAIFSSDNSIVLAALDKQTAPQGTTDESGMFYITDVPSNLYFLQIDDYPKPVMLHEPDDQTNDLTVDWREKEGAVDLGVIPTSILPPQSP
jgi:hypothetical protein